MKVHKTENMDAKVSPADIATMSRKSLDRVPAALLMSCTPKTERNVM